jgi:CDP-diacylglycerol--serine O-phosphatidyltransferase
MDIFTLFIELKIANGLDLKMIISIIKNQAANFLTFTSMVLGLFSIIASTEENFKKSAFLIIIAALFDYFDGFVARRLNTTSKFGKYLDSNSDMISFGVAPGLLIYFSILKTFGVIGIIVSFLFIAGGVFRLARYNATEFSGYYVGIPITVAGTLLALCTYTISFIPPFLFLFITLVLTYLMVSYHSFKKV